MKLKAVIIFIAFIIFSCFGPLDVNHDLIQNPEKAVFLFNSLNDQYKKAVADEDVLKIKRIAETADWVLQYDKLRIEDVDNLKTAALKSMEEIKDMKLKRAKYYIGRKQIVNACVEYTNIKMSDPGNKEAAGFLKDHKTEIDAFVADRKKTAKKLIETKDYNKAYGELKRVNFFVQSDSETKNLMKECDDLKSVEIKTSLDKAKKNFDEKKYNDAISSARFVLGLDPNSKDAIDILQKCSAITKKNVNYKSSVKKDDKSAYYNNAMDLFNKKLYTQAKNEIIKYLSSNNDAKGQDLDNKISAAIKQQVDAFMGDAVFDYNSQKFEEALDLFNKILAVDPSNEIAADYKSRIEKRMKAFE